MFVLDKHGTPLQPCSPARARMLLAKGRAVVAHHTPFVIRLKDRVAADSEIDGVELGVDPGSKHTGIAVFTQETGERRGRYSIQPDYRGAQVRRKVQQRAAYRRGRRTRNLRYRSPRFANRVRPKGWLPPSLRHRVDTTISWVNRLARWSPVRGVYVERVAFDTHVLSIGRTLEGVEYQYGTLCGFEVREYLLAKFSRTCVYCGVTGVPVNVDHVHPRSRGGTDRVSNLVLACVPSNQAKGDRPVEEFVNSPKILARIRSRTKAPLRDAAAVQSIRWVLWRLLDERLPTRVATGGRTKWNRMRNHLPKTHTLDALSVGKVATITEAVSTALTVSCSGRGSYARTTPDRYGFPQLRRDRAKRHYGFTTGDLVHAVVPAGKRRGTHTGRVLVRAKGNFDIMTANGRQPGINHRYVRLLQRADGYAYTFRKETGVPSPA
ncbi:RNA-guided endonuclease IscB [Nocardiopsis sp. HUAS JQ3]|uniref:RNA-guided endonuclease IscB n=1 Tax=Nocardiopsis sp. HUAS JQ3 TaxID=3061629 RepID=UPI0023A989AB|nr:RNA-guided endonuclease IscB [Nocardiopsis sp. HUAS JQ3]WDZ92014.1 RNA-guided endonuclease IscB [Nocardiopsis sp. HUAS JQ3]